MPTIRALDALLTDYKPTWCGIGPRWYTNPPACDKEIRIPAWNWEHPTLTEMPDDQVVTLDVNGAYLAPLSGVKLSLSGLEHTGPVSGVPNVYVPGYYLVDVHRWQDTRIPSPLGSGKLGRRAWVTAPTLELLFQLDLAGDWPEVVVHDSWTAKTERNGRPGVVKLEAWAAWLKQLRADALASGDRDRYDDVKNAYGVAINMLLGNGEGADRKSRVRRPDWNRTIRAAHAANTWRKAWRSVVIWERTLLRMGGVDELAYSLQDFEYLVELQETDAKGAPLKFDLTGHQLGAFKIKAKDEAPAVAG